MITSSTPSAHTAGPWRLEKGRINYFITAIVPALEPTRTEQALIADCPHNGTNYANLLPEEAEANARLIAAAPELLESVKLFLQFFDEMPKGQLGKIVCDIGILNQAFIISRRSIARAEGQY